jgi:hypothetical protein
MKTFYLARISDGHRFDGTKIYANSVKHAGERYAQMGYVLTGLIVVGARP